MKPKYEKVLELAVPSDFSQCAMDAAMDLIWKEIAPEGYHLKRDHYFLEIGVEGDILKAINVCQAWGIGFALNRTFHADEWQLSCTHFAPDHVDVENLAVWCGGA